MSASAPHVRTHLASDSASTGRRPAVTRTNVPARRRSDTVTRVFAILATLALVLGWWLPTERYITPERGIGYALGIIGGSSMLLLLLYSARKRVRWLQFLGPVARWFRGHMVLGIVGPLCILYHSNFSLGATNSNVALWSMITVASSGFIGRYFYAHIEEPKFKRLFSIWHFMHLPLVFMLLIAGIVHVIAVNVY